MRCLLLALSGHSKLRSNVALVAAIFLTTGFAAIGAGPVFSQEMDAIEKYMGQNDFERNPAAAQFVFLRCASIFLLVGGHLQRDSDLQAQAKVYSHGDGFLSMSESVKPFNQEFALEQSGRMTEAYKQRWLRAKALSGNFSDDPVIRSDIQLCSTLTIS